MKQKEKGKDDKKINRATRGIIVLAVVIVINIITIIINNNIITTMCTEVFLFFRREEICHIVNVVCISLHVCETKTKSEIAFFFISFLYFYDFKASLFFPFFSVY